MTLTNNSDKQTVEKGLSNVAFGNSNSTCSSAGGRISRAGITIKLQLLNLSFDQYHIHTSSNIALAILRDIKYTPVRIRRTLAFARRVRNLLTILNNYNRATLEAKGKYPYSKALIRLLVRYVQLEYDVLYHPENYSVKYEKEVEVKVHFFLHLLLDGVVRKFRQENVQHYDSTATECVLRIFNQVNSEYKIKGRFIWSAINKLAKKLGLLETISEIRQNGVLLSQNHPTFTKLSCDNIEDISDCDSEYEIPLSPTRSCASPIENLKLEYPVKREPPDLDSGQDIDQLRLYDDFGSGTGYDDDSDNDSVISDGKLQRLLDVKCEIQDYSSDSDDCVIDLKSEREHSKSVQITGDNYDNKCSNITDVAIKSTNGFAKCEQKLNKNGDWGETSNCEHSNNNSSVNNNKRDDFIIGDSHSNNISVNNKNSNGDILKAPSNAGNSSQVIELDDEDDEDDLIVVTKSANQIKTSPHKAKSPVIVLDSDDENDCVIVNNDEEKIPKCDDKAKNRKIRSFSDNQVNEISSTTGSNITSKNKEFEAYTIGNTSNNYRRMNRSGSSEVHALEDLTPEGVDEKRASNQENAPPNRDEFTGDIAEVKVEDAKDPKDKATTSRIDGDVDKTQTSHPSKEIAVKGVTLTERSTTSQDQTPPTDSTNNERITFRTSNELLNEMRYRCPIYDDDDEMACRSYDLKPIKLMKDYRAPKVDCRENSTAANYTNGYKFDVVCATSSIRRDQEQVEFCTRPFVSETKVIMHQNNVTSLRHDIHGDVSVRSKENFPELRLGDLPRVNADSGLSPDKNKEDGLNSAENANNKTQIMTESVAQLQAGGMPELSLDETPMMPSETPLFNYFSNTSANDHLTNVELTSHEKQRRYFKGILDMPQEQNLCKDTELPGENVVENLQLADHDLESMVQQQKEAIEETDSVEETCTKINENHTSTSEASSDGSFAKYFLDTTPLDELADESLSNQFNTISEAPTKVLDMNSKDAKRSLYEEPRQRYFDKIFQVSQEQNLHQESEQTGEKFQNLKSLPAPVTADINQEKEAITDTSEESDSVDESLDQSYTKTNEQHTSTSKASLDRHFAKYICNTAPLKELADENSTNKPNTISETPKQMLDMTSKDMKPSLYEEQWQRYFEVSQEQNLNQESEETGEKFQNLKSLPAPVTADINQEKEAITDTSEQSDSVDESLDQSYTKTNEQHTSTSKASLDRYFAKYICNTAPLKELVDENPTNKSNSISEAPKQMLDMTSKDMKPSLYEQQRRRYFEVSQEQNLNQESEETGEKFQNLKSLPAPVTAHINQEKEAITDTSEQSDSVDESLDQSYTKTNEQHTSTSKASLDRYFAKYLSNTVPLRELADENPTNHSNTISEAPKQVLDMTSKDMKSSLYEEQRRRYFEVSQEQNLNQESEETGEKFQNLKSLPAPVTADINQEKEAITDISEQSDSVDESLDQSYTKTNEQHTSTSKASLDRNFAKFLSNTAPLGELADENATNQSDTISEAPKQVLDMTSKDMKSSLYEEQRRRYFEVSQEQNLNQESEETGEKFQNLKSLPAPVIADINQEKEAITDTSEQSDSVDESLDQSYTKTNEQHTSTSKASLDRNFAKFLSNTAPLGELADENATNQSDTISEAPKQVLDMTSKDMKSSLYEEQRRRYFEVSQEQNLNQESEETGEKFQNLKSLPAPVTADINQEKEAITDTSEQSDSVDESLDQSYTKTNEQHTSTSKANLNRYFAKYLSNTAPLGELAGENLTNQSDTISEAPKQVLDMSGKDAEPPLYEEQRQRYLEAQNLHKESEQAVESVQDLKSQPDHNVADMEQQKVAVTDTLKQPECVGDESHTKNNEHQTSTSEVRLDRSFSKYLSPLRELANEHPLNRSNTISKPPTKTIDVSRKYVEPPSFEEQRQQYFERTIDTPQEQNLPKDAEQTAIHDPVPKIGDRNSSRSTAKLDRSFAKYCSDITPIKEPKDAKSLNSKYTEPPSFEEQRQKYFEKILETEENVNTEVGERPSSIFTEAILAEASAEDGLSKGVADEDGADLERPIQTDHQHDNEEQSPEMPALNQRESIDSAATELEELLALSTTDVRHEVASGNQVKIGKNQCVHTLSSELEQALVLSQTDCCEKNDEVSEVTRDDNEIAGLDLLTVQEHLTPSPSPSGDKSETSVIDQNVNEEICNETFINSLAGEDIEEIYLVVPGEAASGDKTDENEDEDVVFVLDPSVCDDEEGGEYAGIQDELIRINFLIEEDEVPEGSEPTPNTPSVEYRFNGSDIPTVDEEEICVDHSENQLQYSHEVAYGEVTPENGDLVFLSDQDYISEAVHEVQTTQSTHDDASQHDKEDEIQPIIEDSEVIIEATESPIESNDQIQSEVTFEVQTHIDDLVPQKDAEDFGGAEVGLQPEVVSNPQDKQDQVPILPQPDEVIQDEARTSEVTETSTGQIENVEHEAINYEVAVEDVSEATNDEIAQKTTTTDHVSVDDVILTKESENSENHEVPITQSDFDDFMSRHEVSHQVPVDLSKKNEGAGCGTEDVVADDHVLTQTNSDAAVDGTGDQNQAKLSAIEATKANFECIKLESPSEETNQIALGKDEFPGDKLKMDCVKNEIFLDAKTVMNMHEVNIVPHYVNANYADIHMKYIKDEVITRSQCITKEDMQDFVKAQITDFSDKCQILYPSVAIQHDTPRPMSLSTLSSKFAESLAEKTEDIYYENLEILATAAAAQKSLKIEGAPKVKRSRVKMAAFSKSRAAKFKPNEVRETLRPQPANTIDATILAESDFNAASEDSCDSYGGKLIIAEEEHISNIDEAVFDEDTVDEKITFVPTKLEDIEDTEIRICITDSEKYERAFNELELLEMDDVIEDDGFKSSPKRGRTKNVGNKLKIKEKKQNLTKPRQNKNKAENNLDKEGLPPKSSPIDLSFKPLVKNSVKKPRTKSPKKVAKIENNVAEVKNKIKTDNVVKDETKAKDEVGLGFDRFLMGESLMLTHDGEFVKVHSNASATKPKLIPASPDKLSEEVKTVNDVSAIKQPIRTKAALKSYDKKNLNLAEDKFKLRPYVKLVTDPTIQKMIDNLPDSTKSATTMPKISLGRKNYRSLLDARKLLHRTSVIQNQKLKIDNVPKIREESVQKTAAIEELKKPPTIAKAKSPVRRSSLDPAQIKGVPAEIKPGEAKLSNKVQAVPKYRKISRSISLIDSKSTSLPNLSTNIDKKLNKSNKTGSGSNPAINGVKSATTFNKKSNCNGLQIKNNISKQDDLNLKKTLSKLSQFGTTFEEIKIEKEIQKTQTINEKDDVKKVKKTQKDVPPHNSENKNANSSQKMKPARKILDRRKTDESFLKKKTNMKPKEEELVSKLKTRRLSVDVELISFDKCKTNHFTKIAKETHNKNEVERSKVKLKEDGHLSVKRKHLNKIIKDLDNLESIQSKKSDAKKSKVSPDRDTATIKQDKVDKLEPEEADKHVTGERKLQNEIIKDGDHSECIQSNEFDAKTPKISPDHAITIIEQDKVDEMEPEGGDKHEKADQEVIESISGILNEIVRKIEEAGNAMIEVGTEITTNQYESVPTPQQNCNEYDMEAKTESEEIEPKLDQIKESSDSEQIETKIPEENLDQNKLEVTPIKTLKELATEYLNANRRDAIQQKSLEQDEMPPKTVENESEVGPTQPPTIELEKIQNITDLSQNSESAAPIIEQKLDIKENEDQIMEETKEVVADIIEKVVAKLRKESIPELLNLTKLTPKGVGTFSPHNNVAAKSYTRKPIIKKRQSDLKQSLQKEVPFQYVPKKKKVTFNAKEIILNAAEFDAKPKIVTSTEKPTNTELNPLNIESNNVRATTSPKILNFEQCPLDLGTSLFPNDDKLKRKSLDEPPIIAKKQKTQDLPQIEIEKLKLSVRNKLERNQVDQKNKEQTITSPTKRRDRKNIDEVINILRSNLEEKIEITIVQVIDDEKSNETVEDLKKITGDNQKTRLFQPWQDTKPYQPKLDDKSEENDIPSDSVGATDENSHKDPVEDVGVKEIEKLEEKQEDVSVKEIEQLEEKQEDVSVKEIEKLEEKQEDVSVKEIEKLEEKQEDVSVKEIEKLEEKQEDVSVKEIKKLEEKHEDVEEPPPAPAETLELTNLEETEPEMITTETAEIPLKAIEEETTDQEIVLPQKDVELGADEIPDAPVSNSDVPEVAEIPPPLEIRNDFENFAENIFSTSTPLRLIQREYSFISEEDAVPKNDEELTIKDEPIKADEVKEIIADEDNFEDKQMPNLSPIVDTNDNSSSTTEEDDKEMMKLTTDSQLTPPPILEKEVPTPIGTNFATSALLDGADDVMSSVLENIPGQEKTFNFASEESLFDDSSKTSDMLLNFNENQFMNEKDQDLNIATTFPEITDKPINISYDSLPAPTPIDKPTDTNHSRISDIIPSSMEPNEMSWPPVSTSESFLKNHDFVQDTIPEDSPVKTEALSMIYAKPTTPEKIDKKSMEIKNESIHKSGSHQRFADNLAAIPSTSKMCESSHLSAITTQMSSFGTDQVLTTRASDLHSAVNFGSELGVNTENPNSMFGKDFDTIDEDDTPIIEKVKAYGTMHIGSGTNSDHNYSMGGPFLGGEYESSELSTKQLAQENDQKGNSTEDFGNTGIEGDSMFPFSAQVCISFIENNLTQESNRSLNHSPVDGGTDYHLPEQDGQLPFSFTENQDATQQLQDSQNTIKILNQECDSRQEDNITSFREDFSNPMSVENMSSIQFNDFPLTNLGFEDIDRISFTAATVQSHDNQNHLLKGNEREKVTVIYNEHDFASTNSIKEITCLETPQLNKDDLIRSSIKHEVLSARQRRQSPEKVGGRSPKKNKKCKERDAPLSNFSSAMTAKAMADIARKKIENKRERVDYGYIRQNTKTQVLAPVKKVSPTPTPDRKSPQQIKSNSSSPVRNEIIDTDAEIVPNNEKVESASKPEEALPILVEKPKDHKEIAQEKLRDLLSTISINNKFDTVKLRRRQPPERLSDTLAMEMLVKDTKNQLKQFSRPPTSPKQYPRSQNKPKKPIKLDKPGGKLVDYDDSSLSDEPPAKFYEKIKKDKSDYPSKRYSDTSDDDFLNKPKRTPTKTDLNRADDPSFYRLNNGEHAPKRPGDNSDLDFPNRSKIPRTQAEIDRVFDALKRSEDTNKIARKKEDTKNANQDFNLTPRWATSSSSNYYDPKRRIAPPQPRHDQRLYQNKSRSAIILNSQYNSQNTPYKRYQASTSQNPPNPRNLCSNSRLPPGGKHASVPYGADGSAARAASHNNRSSHVASVKNTIQNPKSSSAYDWLNNLDGILDPPSVTFGTEDKR